MEGCVIKVRRNGGSKLRLVRGSYPYRTKLGAVDVVASPQEWPPFMVDAVAVEEDTFLVMSAERQVREAREPLMKVMTRVIETRPHKPGTVLVRGKSPLRFLAIVHDLNEEPSWKQEWIEAALKRIFLETEKRRLRSIGLPFLGTLHGSLGKQRFVSLLRRTAEQISTTHLRRLWLIMPPKTGPKVLGSLKEN